MAPSLIFYRDLLRQQLPLHLQPTRSLYVVLVVMFALFGAVTAGWVSPSPMGRTLSFVFSGLMLVLLFALFKGMQETHAVYLGGSLGMAYLFTVSLTEGHIYSSTLAWVPLIPLMVFYVISPRAGRFWILLALCIQLLMGVVAWFFGPQLPDMNGPGLAMMSFTDGILVTIMMFFVPNIYQRELEKHLHDSQRRQSELQIKQVELEQTLRMREHFIAVVSHELRTPMNAILGLNALLLACVTHKPQARKVLEYTRQSADHLMTVINDVLDYSQLSTGVISPRLERFALRETVRAAFELFMPKIESTRLRFECEIAQDVPVWVQTDRHRLMQVLVNLLGNAIKFTHQGRVVLRVVAQGGGVEFSVLDSGIGIPAQQQQRIFERFSQADASIQSRFGGSGLGLTISQRLVQMLGGQLALESQEGVGSRFWFSLPLQCVLAPDDAMPPKEQDPEKSQQAWRFLLVDDHAVNRLLVRQLLVREWPKAKVSEVENGAQALALLGQDPPFDLVLMDMVMPIMDGIEATRAMRLSPNSQIRKIPVLGLTANVSTAELALFEQAGLDGLLLKPFELKHLMSQVTRLIGADVLPMLSTKVQK
jgi:signal transduction histidine kinase/CheY-like chemotaxis protein